MSSGRWSCAVVCCLVLVSWCAGAADEVEDGDKRTIYLGAGALISTQPYKGVDARIYAVPLFAYEGKRLYVRGIVGGYRLYSIGDWSVGPVIQPRFEGYEEQDSPFLNGMDDRDWSLDGGVGTSLLTKYGLFGLSFVTDLLGRHNGQELEFSYTILFELAGFELIPTAGVRWKTENLVDYYYGVESDEARAGRPAYEASDAFDPFLRLALRRKLSERWSVLGAVQYEWLDGEMTDSPIVDDDYDASFMVGALYSW